MAAPASPRPEGALASALANSAILDAETRSEGQEPVLGSDGHWQVELPALERPAEYARGLYQRLGKRTLDLALGIPLFIFALPIISILASVVVLTSGWPPFYTGQRLGRGGREFTIWKIRTMVPDADEALARWRETDAELASEFRQHFKLKDDPRVTPVGRFLRRSSLDELPQLWNVIRGDMSLVGPRPIVRDELAHYGQSATELLASRPGVTGGWQLNGRNLITYPERARVELECCRCSSFLGDIKLIARTALAPFNFNGL